jgi:Leu/Phe-tRNA-protein transferase
VSITRDDIVAVGGDLRPETLLGAYRQGVFPWPLGGLHHRYELRAAA